METEQDTEMLRDLDVHRIIDWHVDWDSYKLVEHLKAVTDIEDPSVLRLDDGNCRRLAATSDAALLYIHKVARKFIKRLGLRHRRVFITPRELIAIRFTSKRDDLSGISRCLYDVLMHMEFQPLCVTDDEDL